MITCQATVKSDKFEAWDSCAEWCRSEAVTTVPLTLIPMHVAHYAEPRIANVWLCQEHYDEFMRVHEL